MFEIPTNGNIGVLVEFAFYLLAPKKHLKNDWRMSDSIATTTKDLFMKRLLLSLISLISLVLFSCSDTKFSSNKHTEIKNLPPDQENTSDSGSPARVKTIEDTLVDDDDIERKRADLKNSTHLDVLGNLRCWFAVSGWYNSAVGLRYDPSDQATFPKPLDGQVISHGSRFDRIGGVFLAAREKPYVYGGGVIDEAVDGTFDSIAIAPGMRAEIRDGGGGLLFEGDGPILGVETRYHNLLGSDKFQQLKSNSKLPSWMQKYSLNHSGFKSIPLQKARWVKVTSINGQLCEGFEVKMP
jgi:hypothetical protein